MENLEHLPPALKERVKARLRVELEKRKREARNRGDLERDLSGFHKSAWPNYDPAAYLHNWHMDAVCDHLSGLMHGHIPRLMITEPPRTTKSSLVSVSFPPFVWAQNRKLPLAGPHVKFIGVAYDPKLAVRDATKSRRLMDSPWYRDRWGDRFNMMKDRDRADMYENSAGGFRFSTSVAGGLTGEGGDIIIVDDPINAKKANWESARVAVNEWWDETVPTRLNDQLTGAKIVIMQRLHEDDLVGHILEKIEDEDWVHLNLPMEFDPSLDTRTWVNGKCFFEDPRTTEGELLWPERFPAEVVEKLKTSLGPFASAAQLQQSPTPRGGSIIDRLWWQVWDENAYRESQGAEYSDGILRFPPCSLIVGSVDTAYGDKKKDENAFNAMTVWGVFQDKRERPGVVMMEAFRGRWPLRAIYPPGCETEDERRPHWALAERIADSVRRRHIDILLIENKTRGGDLEKEVKRLLDGHDCQVLLLEPEGNKVARLYAVQPLFADGRVFAPEKSWAETVMTEVSQFPKSKYADYCLVAGTLVATRRGPIPIEDVRPGDQCITPAGWRTVTAAGQTGVCPITTARGLTGTLDHPVFTLDKGYQRLDTVTQASQLSRFGICDLIRLTRLNEFNSMVGLTNVWADRENITWTKRVGPKGKQDLNQRGSMSLSGVTQPVRKCRQAMRSTISITTHSIAGLRIWSAYRRACTAAFLSTMAQDSLKTWHGFARSLWNGTDLKKAALGIGLMPSPVSPKRASQKIASNQLRVAHAFGAEHQWRERTAGRNSVPTVALGRKAAGAEANTNSTTPIMQPVFNVTVEGEGCYYANGILVHNTDTVSMALSWMRRSGVLLLSLEADEDNLQANTFRSSREPPYNV